MEAVIEAGMVYEGKIVYEEKGKGVLAAGDAALDGKALGEVIISVLESRSLF